MRLNGATDLLEELERIAMKPSMVSRLYQCMFDD